MVCDQDWPVNEPNDGSAFSNAAWQTIQLLVIDVQIE